MSLFAWLNSDGSHLSRLLVLVLGHSLWQAAGIALFLRIALRFLRADQVRWRYALCITGLFSVVAAVCFTAAIYMAPAPGGQAIPSIQSADAATPGDRLHAKTEAPPPGGVADSNASSDPGKSATNRSPNPASSSELAAAEGPATLSPSEPAPLQNFPAPQKGKVTVSPHPWAQPFYNAAALAWLGGFLIMLTRMVGSVKRANNLKRSAEPVKETFLQQQFDTLCRALAIRGTVALRATMEITSPVVIGFFQPAVILPLSYLSGVSPDFLRAVLVHELAHIRRLDYFVNILQMVAESFLFFNPAVWWISCQVRIEREACCDNLAAAMMGDTHRYATALLHAAELTQTTTLPPALAMASPPPAGLAQRIRRLLSPTTRPSVRLPWFSLAAGVVIALLLITGLWTGGLAGVAFARALSDKDRMHMIEQVESEFGTGTTRQSQLDERTTVSGRLLLPRGESITSYTVLHTYSHGPRYASAGLLQVTPGGTFQGTIVPGSVYLGAEIEGFAPLLTGPYQLKSNAPLTDLQLSMTRGYASEIQVLDENNQPVPRQKMTLRYAYPERRNPLLSQELKTDANGIAIIDHATTHPAILELNDDGFEPIKEEIARLPRDGRHTIQLARALVTTGTVVNASNGEPVPGAGLLLARSSGPDGNRVENLTTATVTDAEGVFRLTDLRADTTYNYLVTAPPHRPSVLTNVTAGQGGIEVQMQDPLGIVGKITGSPEKVRPIFYGDPATLSKGPALSITESIMISDSALITRHHRVPIFIKDGVGTFAATGLSPGHVELSWDSGIVKRLPLNLQESLTSLTLSTEAGVGPGESLNAPTAPDPGTTRPVTLRFQHDNRLVAPTGTIFLNYNGIPGDKASANHRPQEISSAEIRFVVQVPSGVTVAPAGTIGYWFDRTSFRVDEGSTDFVYNIDCVPAGSISGKVLDADKQPIVNAYLSVTDDSAASDRQSQHPLPEGTVSNSEGKFHLTPLPLDRSYTIKVSRENYVVASEQISLNATVPTRQVSIQFAEGVPLDIHLVDAKGLPAAGVPIRLRWELRSSVEILADQLTDHGGRARVPDLNDRVPGKYVLEINPRHHFQPMRLPVTPGASPVTIQLKRGGSLRGRILDNKTGQPVSGLEVFATPSSLAAPSAQPRPSARAEDLTDSDGSFQFSNLPPGRQVFRIPMTSIVEHATGNTDSDEEIVIKITRPEIAQ